MARSPASLLDRSTLDTLLSTAGLDPAQWKARAKPGGHTNRSWVVTGPGRGRVVYRQYGWPYAGDPDPARGVKERWLHERLAACGVAVPAILAAEPGGVLMEFVGGELLGALAIDDPRRAQDAWAQAGRMLRRAHGCPVPWDTPGRIIGDELEPMGDGSWATWMRVTTMANARSLIDAGRSVDVGRIGRVLDAARGALEAAPRGLLHNDAHAWNAMVATGAVYWLDWEFAWVGDWVWDLARLDIFRVEDIGPTPPAFLRGYGRRPDALRYKVCELSIYLWMARQAAEGDTLLAPTYRAADRYVADLAEHLMDIERSLGA